MNLPLARSITLSPLSYSVPADPNAYSLTMNTAAGAATTFPFVFSFHRPCLRPCPRCVVAVLPAHMAGSSSS